MQPLTNCLRGLLILGLMLLGGGTFAQDGYHVSEGYTPDSQTADAGPVRMARFGLIEGGVSWRPDEKSEWSAATPNMPLRQGAQVSVDRGGRGEVQFDDGSVLRLGSSALATLTTMYSDSKGEFTEIQLNDGLFSMTMRNGYSLYQFDTPYASVRAYGPARVRIGVGQGLEVASHEGQVQIQNSQGTLTLNPNEYLYMQSADSPLEARPVPREDGWDRFGDERDAYWEHRSDYLPPNIALVSGDLDDYGHWASDPTYGYVWYPQVSDPGWRPYWHGHWVWVSPYGWTWCGDETWGWAPYHYGTWIHRPGGWGWVPGPARQCWSPAVVSFTGSGETIAWCPLAPSEVRYPATALAIRFGGGSWSVWFSIGGCAAYYPAGPGYCAPHPWTNVYVNRVTVYNVTQVNYFNGHGVVAHGFVPHYASFATYTDRQGFVGGGSYRPLPAGRAAMFRTGHPFVGGPGLKPAPSSFTASRSFSSVHPNQAIFNRPVFRSAVPRVIGQRSSGHPVSLRPGTSKPASARQWLRSNHVNPGGPMKPYRGPSNPGRPSPEPRPTPERERPAAPKPEERSGFGQAAPERRETGPSNHRQVGGGEPAKHEGPRERPPKPPSHDDGRQKDKDRKKGGGH